MTGNLHAVIDNDGVKGNILMDTSISFPIRNFTETPFHNEMLCLEIQKLFEEYITSLKENTAIESMSEEQKTIYYQIQEKMMLLDTHDVQKVLPDEDIEKLHSLEKKHELESFIHLLKMVLLPDDSLQIPTQLKKQNSVHK